MKNKVIGIGLSKTGTSTLRECFAQLGLNDLGFDADLTRAVIQGATRSAIDVLANYEAAANFPWSMIYKEIDAVYPDCRFVLTVRRNSQTWLKSLKSQAEKRPNSVYREWIYGCRNPVGNERRLIQQYERHNDEVRSHFANRSDKLLEVCWETGSGWHELCEFLDLPIPGTPFPHANRSPAKNAGLLKTIRSAIGLRKTA